MKSKNTAAKTSFIIMEELNIELHRKAYALFVKNKDLPYKEFIKNINDELDKKYNCESLKNLIQTSTTVLSPDKRRNMLIILKYSIAKQKGNIEVIRELKEEVDNIKINTKPSAMFVQYSDEQRTKKIYKREEKIKNIKSDLDATINNETTKSKVNLLAKAKSTLKNIDNDTYIDFLISRNKLEKLSLDEIKQDIEVLEFFIKNLEKNLDILNSYNPENDEEKIRNFHVTGEEELPSKYNSIKNLYNWKVKKIESYIRRYNNLYNSLNKILTDKSFESFSKIDDDTKSTLRKEGCLLDLYKRIEKMCTIYQRDISSINTVSDKRVEELKDNYTKRLMFENN